MSNDLLEFAQGEVIFQQGYPADNAYTIIKGRVGIYLEELDGKEKPLAILKEGQMFGEMGIIDEAPRSASARALEAVVLQIVPI